MGKKDNNQKVEVAKAEVNKKTNETKKKGSIVIPATNVISDEPGERISLRRP